MPLRPVGLTPLQAVAVEAVLHGERRT